MYPFEWREEFGMEMELVFSEAAMEAAERGALGPFFLRELRDIPPSLVRAYWNEWVKKWQKGIQLLRKATSSSDLPAPPLDGRKSWKQVLYELSSVPDNWPPSGFGHLPAI